MTPWLRPAGQSRTAPGLEQWRTGTSSSRRWSSGSRNRGFPEGAIMFNAMLFGSVWAFSYAITIGVFPFFLPLTIPRNWCIHSEVALII